MYPQGYIRYRSRNGNNYYIDFRLSDIVTLPEILDDYFVFDFDEIIVEHSVNYFSR